MNANSQFNGHLRSLRSRALPFRSESGGGSFNCNSIVFTITMNYAKQITPKGRITAKPNYSEAIYHELRPGNKEGSNPATGCRQPVAGIITIIVRVSRRRAIFFS